MDASLNERNEIPFIWTDFRVQDYKRQLEQGIRFRLKDDKDFCVRNIGKNDIDTISRIEKSVFSDPWTEMIIKTYLEDDYYFLAFLGQISNEVVSYSFCRMILDELHIDNLAVRKEYRRLGLGTIMVWMLLKVAKIRDVNRAYLEVRISNGSAISLYEKFGFRKVGVRPRYYADNNEDAFLMTKEL
ncbi:ribosomal-protein-alanine N-acetyltransferase [candidate division KSB1 bacterium]|nr:ribosomal-protein-alanine N-acetyltransferase [candidate division KSB1 bacterium]